MRIVEDLPHDVEHHETEWIPVGPDVRLAARSWRPVGATDDPVPAILEFLPYRRRDTTRERDDENMGYLAGHGYACLRVDLRGSGDSDGVLLDEYLTQEQDDAIAVIRWIAEQPWCDGQVGMMGISWGGLQRPAGRGAPARRARCGRQLQLDRRPLRRRRALHGWLPPGRQPVVGIGDVRLQLDPAGPGGRRRPLA